jgi:hypothetical protein
MPNSTLRTYLDREHETLTVMRRLHIVSFSFEANYGSLLLLKA